MYADGARAVCALASSSCTSVVVVVVVVVGTKIATLGDLGI